jgi:hypothetical protein
MRYRDSMSKTRIPKNKASAKPRRKKEKPGDKTWYDAEQWRCGPDAYQILNEVILQSIFRQGFPVSFKREDDGRGGAKVYLVTLPLSKLKKNLNLHYRGKMGTVLLRCLDTVAFNADSRLKFTTGDADMGESEKDPAKGYLCYLFCKKESADCLKAGFDAYLKKKGYDFGDEVREVPFDGRNGEGPDSVDVELPKA